jgi:flotillin
MGALENVVFTVVGIAVIFVVVLMVFVSRYLIICQPNEIVILSGRKRNLPDGKVVGYRVIRGGRALRIPIIEKAARMSLETFPLELTVVNAYSRGGIPLRVDAIANVKVSSSEPQLGNAVERLLDRQMKEIQKIAKDTLEGNLRGVLATLTPEEVNEDRLKFAQSLIDEADHDLQQLGLHLDTLKIQNVHDDAGYLDSIGRKKTAEVLANARQAEAERAADAEKAEAEARQMAQVAKAKADQGIRTAQIEAELEVKRSQATADGSARKAQAEQAAEAQEAEADSRRRADVAKAVAAQRIQTAEIEADQMVKTRRADADQQIVIASNNLRMKQAELEKVAIIKEQEAHVAGEKAKVQFEQSMEEERIILQQKRLTADVIEPARAKREAMEQEAKGSAAPIIEEGLARMRVLSEMVKTYQSAKGEGEKVFMLNMLPEIVSELVETVKKVSIEKVTVIDSGSSDGKGGGGVGRFVNQLPGMVISLAEQIETATGVKILSGFQGEPAKPAEEATELKHQET